MNVVIKDKKTEKTVALPLPISEEYSPLTEILSCANLSVAEFNLFAKQLEDMDGEDIRRYAICAAAFLPHFLYVPEAFIILTKAIDYVQIFPDCTNYSQLGESLSAADIQSEDTFAAGIKTASENIVGFYDGAAMLLTADDYEKAYSQFADEFYMVDEIGSELS